MHLVSCLQGIPAGSQLVRVPLRLAITDVMEDEEKQQLVGQVGGLRCCDVGFNNTSFNTCVVLCMLALQHDQRQAHQLVRQVGGLRCCT
jgi:hypothetical protein